MVDISASWDHELFVRWLFDHADEEGVNASKIALGGDSADGAAFRAERTRVARASVQPVPDVRAGLDQERGSRRWRVHGERG
jgi:hypothetical protein